MGKVTIDDLALMVQKGFNQVDEKIDSVEARLNEKIDSVEARLNEKIDSVEARLNEKIDNVETRLNEKIDGVENKLDGKIGSVRSDIRRLELSLEDIKEKLSRIEKRSFEDDEVLAKELVDLRKRVDFLEKECRRIKLA